MATLKRTVLLIGIGAGNPEHMTVQAIAALNRANVVFIPGKGAEKATLAGIRRDICERFLTRTDTRLVDFAMPVRRGAEDGYEGAVADWHAAMAAIYARLLAEELAEGQCGAFLVWGDPALYDSTLRILDRLEAEGRFVFDCTVIPGITAVQALAAAHRVPLNAIGQSVLITTGRRLAEGLPREGDSVVVMLDAGGGLRSIGGDLDIWWGANIGTPDEVLVSGPIEAVRDDIERERSSVRARQGWVMDTYLLRRRRPEQD